MAVTFKGCLKLMNSKACSYAQRFHVKFNFKGGKKRKYLIVWSVHKQIYFGKINSQLLPSTVRPHKSTVRNISTNLDLISLSPAIIRQAACLF